MIKEKDSRNGTIDLLKILAAVIVLLGHINEFGCGNIGNAGNTLSLVVELFFMISGFFLMMHIDHLPADSNENTFVYALGKIKGFFAPLCVANAVQFFLACRLNNVNTIAGVAAKLWHFKEEFLLLQCLGLIQKPQFNQDYLLGPAWYLSAMMITLIILYPLAKYYRKVFINIICPVSIVFIYAAFIYQYGTLNVGNDNLFFVQDSLPRAFAGQCCGVLCYCLYQFIKKEEVYNNTAYKAVDTVCWLMFPLMIILAVSGIHDAPVFFILPLSAIVVSSMLGKSPVSNQLSKIPLKITDFLGKMSLYIYLTHSTIVLMVYRYMSSLEPCIKVLMSILLTLVYSILLYFFEKKRHGIKWVCIICLLAVVASFIQVLC